MSSTLFYLIEMISHEFIEKVIFQVITQSNIFQQKNTRYILDTQVFLQNDSIARSQLLTGNGLLVVLPPVQ